MQTDLKEYFPLINKQPVHCQKSYTLYSPFDKKPLGLVHNAQKEQMDMAILATHSAFKETRLLSVYDRITILENLLHGIKKREKLLAETITSEGGKPIRFARNEVFRAQITVQSAIDVLRTWKGEILPLDISPQTIQHTGYLRRFPIGTIIGITPFNFPLNLVLHKMAPAIATGNPIIIKPASQTPLTALILGDILKEMSIPGGMINILPIAGSDAEYLLLNPGIKKLSFTGSADVGWHLKKLAYNKKVTLELGGNAGVIIGEDCDLDFAVPRLVLGSMAHSGQVCISVQRIFVEQSVYSQFLKRFIAEIESNKLYGDPTDENVIMGPMINSSAIDRIALWIREAVKEGAQILTGGERNDPFYLPTVLTKTTPEMKVNKEEIFGPVVTIESFNGIDDAIEKVNHSKYGLQASIFTNKSNWIQNAYRDLEVGGVIVNDYPTFRIDPMPYGGVKESGCGREGLLYAMEDMTELKLMVARNN